MKPIHFICLFLCLTTFAAHPAHAQTQTVLYNFQGSPDGANPEGNLTSYNGNFYGVTNAGGIGKSGTVFELTPNGAGGWNESVLYNFCSLSGCADGSAPTYGYVIFDSLGNMYGTTWSGGANNDGVVWKLSPSGADWKETVLYNFETGNGVSGLVMDGSGNLYGATCDDCTYEGADAASVFELSPSGSSWTEQTIYTTDETYAGLTIDAAGNLFGSTLSTVYELSPNGSGGWTGSTIYNFEADENGEFEVPALDSAGNLYGTTGSGGHWDYGAVWKLTPVTSGKKKGTWTETILHSFNGGQQYSTFPYAGVVLDAAGNIYGTTASGGVDERGTVYELSPSGKVYTEKLLWGFDITNGATPYGGLILDSSGNLYGTTGYGGSDSDGVVFELNPSGIPNTTTTTLTSSPNPSTSGDAVTFTATVTPAPPDGETVSFKKGEEVIGTGTLSGGSASFIDSSLPVGSTTVSAEYAGDGNFLGSKSNTVKQIVDR
jgi:uncharacterized repeat protein (TIGR03803 family)